MYLDESFFDITQHVGEDRKNIFINQHNGLIYLKSGENYYRQDTKDNPFIYVKDDQVDELKDLTILHLCGTISDLKKDEVSKQVYQYVCNALSKMKKPEESCIYDLLNKEVLDENKKRYISSKELYVDIYNEGRVDVFLDELLYVPKQVKDLQLSIDKISLDKDGAKLTFFRRLSDKTYRISYDKDFNVVKEKYSEW